MNAPSESEPLSLERVLDYGQPRQLPTKVLTVLEATIRMLGARSMAEMSVESICRASGVSRATVYRYFSSKEDLLSGVGEFICQGYESGVIGAAAACDDPLQRFANVMKFLNRYTEERGLLRIFEADASFHLAFFRSHYARHKAAVTTALEQTFDYIETRDQIVIDRDVTAGRLVRMQLSRLVVPFEAPLASAWDTAGDTIENWIVSCPASL